MLERPCSPLSWHRPRRRPSRWTLAGAAALIAALWIAGVVMLPLVVDSRAIERGFGLGYGAGR